MAENLCSGWQGTANFCYTKLAISMLAVQTLKQIKDRFVAFSLFYHRFAGPSER